MTQQVSTLTFTAAMTTAIAAKRFVNWDFQQAIAGQAVCGVADHAGVIGENVRVIKGVSAMVEVGAAITAADKTLMSDAQGRAVPFNATPATNVIAARLKPGQTATAAGQVIEVLLF